MIEALRTFQKCASLGLDDNARMIINGTQVGKGDADAGILSRAKLSQPGKLTQAEENNNIRTALLNALAEEFKSKGGIPESIKAALKGSSLVGGSDMSRGKDGKVDSGRPLTMRRIRAVMTAVQKELEKDAMQVPTEVPPKAESQKEEKPKYESVATFIGDKGQKRDWKDEDDYVPHYGFSGVRTTADETVSKYMGAVESKLNADDQANFHGFKSALTRIDEMNFYIGLKFYDENDAETLKISNYSCVLSDALRERDVPEGVEKKNYKHLLEGWKAYLREHRETLDVFSRIKTIENEAQNGKESGWAGIAKRDGLRKALQVMVWKNLPTDKYGTIEEEDVEFFAETLKELSDLKYETDLERDEVRNEKFEDKLNAYCEKKGKDAEELRGVFNNMLSIMFFRRTSKLGLDFFAEKKMQVAFEWTDYQGNELKSTSKDDLEKGVDQELSSKWWKDENPGQKGQEHHGATITFSEMRHVLKKDMIAKGEVKQVQPKAPKAPEEN